LWSLFCRANGGRGGQWRCHRELLDAMFWEVEHGRRLARSAGTLRPVAVGLRPFSPAGRHDGTFARILAVLRLQLDELGRIDWDTWCVDGSNIRADAPLRALKKKGAPEVALGPLPRRLGLRKSIS